MGRWIMVLLAVVLAACGPSAPEAADAPSPADAAPGPDAPSDAARAPGAVPSGTATPTAPAGAAPAPFDTVTLVGGGQLKGGDLAGSDLALWFWAPW